MLANTTTPDGYTVDANGAWIENGVVQQRASIPEIDEIGTAKIGNENAGVGAVTDGKSVTQITLNTELSDLIRKQNTINNFPDRVQIDSYKGSSLNRYTTTYKGKDLQIQATIDGEIRGYVGYADQIFNNIPVQGISVDAFYENTGFDIRAKYITSTGNSDEMFGLAQGTYEMTWMGTGDISSLNTYRKMQIVLTQGSDGNYYIYPDSQLQLN